MKKALLSVLALAVLAAGAAGISGDEITTAGLLEGMVRLERLARSFPEGTRMVQFSSYDRSSRIEDGETVGWWANVDLGQYLRAEQNGDRVEYVMAEVSGPGAIVRMWSANPGSRMWRVYLDGSSEPAIEARGTDLLGGGVKPWGPAFSARRNMGGNFIFPIPFGRSCKVTVSHRGGQAGANPPMMYYQVGVLIYPEGTRVKSFSMDEALALGPEIDRVGGIISDPALMPVPEGRVEEAQVNIAPGAGGELFRLSGPGAVRLFSVEVTADDKALCEVVGKTLLTMNWDGESRPSVSVPLGDFFGTSPGAEELRSVPVSVAPVEGGAVLASRWVMPFKKGAVISLENRSGKRLRLTARAVVSDWGWGDDSLYFHACWREKNGIPTRPYTDMRMLEAEGRGHFVGLEMNVRNPMELFWWGEGDEKVWVDDDSFPSIFGTGTEDYFGYAWCVQYFKFTHGYHGVSVPTKEWLAVYQLGAIPFVYEAISNATPRRAVVSQYRWHVLDPIVFHERLEFDMEIMHHRETAVDVNAAAFWYQSAGGSSDAGVPDLSGREVWAR